MSLELRIDDADRRCCATCGRAMSAHASVCPQCDGEKTWALGNFGGPLLVAAALLAALVGFALTGHY